MNEDSPEGRQAKLEILKCHGLCPWVSTVTNLEPFGIQITFADNTPASPDTLIVSVAGIDEYATEEDWERIWRHYISPRQEYFWGLRGMKPQGRRSVDIKRLEEALPGYRKMVLESWKITDLLCKPVSKLGDWDPVGKLADWDPETIRNAIADLKELLEPGIIDDLVA